MSFQSQTALCWPSNLQYFESMFYLLQNLVSEVVVSASQMHLIAKDSEIIKRLKEKIEGRCFLEHGYIIRFVEDGYNIGVPVVEDSGCKVEVRFNAISFKPDKQQIIDILVSEVNEDLITGSLGHAIVLIPKSKIEGWVYKKEEGGFVDERVGEKIEKDSKLRCRCFDYFVDMNYQMKIIAKLDSQILGLIQ